MLPSGLNCNMEYLREHCDFDATDAAYHSYVEGDDV